MEKLFRKSNNSEVITMLSLKSEPKLNLVVGFPRRERKFSSFSVVVTSLLLLSGCTIMEGTYTAKDGSNVDIYYASTKTQDNPRFEVTKDTEGHIAVNVGTEKSQGVSVEQATKILGSFINEVAHP